MYLTKEQLRALLHIPPPKSEEEQLTVSYSDEGPGNYNTWAALRYVDPYQQLEYASESAQKQKIIISDTLPVTDETLAFMDALIASYDVYCWPGDDTPFASCKPVVSVSDFFDRQSNLQAASKQSVQQELSKQLVGANDCLILDYLFLKEIQDNLKKISTPSQALSEEEPLVETLDLRGFNFKNTEKLNELAKKIKGAVIKRVIIDDSPDSERMYDFFQKMKITEVDHLVVNEPLKNSTDFFKQYSEHNIKINTMSVVFKAGEKFVWKINEKELIVKDSDSNLFNSGILTFAMRIFNLRKIEFDWVSDYNLFGERPVDCRELTSIRLRFKPGDGSSKRLMLQQYPLLREVSLSASGNKFSDIVFSNENRIEFLELQTDFNMIGLSDGSLTLDRSMIATNRASRYFVFDYFPELKKFIFSQQNKETQITWPSKPCRVKTMDLLGAFHSYDFSHFPELESLRLEGIFGRDVSLDKINFSPLYDQLKEINLAGGERYQTLNLSKFKKLERIKIENFRDLSLIWPEDSDSIESIVIKDCEGLSTLDFSRFKNLKEVIIENCRSLYSIELPQQGHIKKLIVKNCESLCVRNVKTNDLLVDSVELNNIDTVDECPWVDTVADLHIRNAKGVGNVNNNIQRLVRLNFSQYTNLKTLKIEDSRIDNLAFPNKTEQLTKLVLIDCEFEPSTQPKEGMLVQSPKKSARIKKRRNSSEWVSQSSLDLSSLDHIKEIVFERTNVDKILWPTSGQVKSLQVIVKKQEIVEGWDERTILPKYGAVNFEGLKEIDDLTIECDDFSKIKFPEGIKIKRLKIKGYTGSNTLDLKSIQGLESLEILGYTSQHERSRALALGVDISESIHLPEDMSQLRQLILNNVDYDQKIASSLSKANKIENLSLSNCILNDPICTSVSLKELHLSNITMNMAWHSRVTAPSEKKHEMLLEFPELKSLSIKQDNRYNDSIVLTLQTEKLESFAADVNELTVNFGESKRLNDVTIHCSNDQEVQNTCLHNLAPHVKKTITHREAPKKVEKTNLWVEPENEPQAPKEQKKTVPEQSSGSTFSIFDVFTGRKRKNQRSAPRQIERTAEERALDEKNKESKVSFLNMESETGIDDRTGFSRRVNKHSGGLKVELFSASPEPKNYYRVNIHNRCRLVKGLIKNVVQFYPTDAGLKRLDGWQAQKKDFDKEVLSFIKAEGSKEGMEAGLISGQLEPGRFYPLVNTGPVERNDAALSNQLFIDKPEAVDVYWDKSYQRYAVKLKEGQKAAQIKLGYFFKLDSDYKKELLLKEKEKILKDKTLVRSGMPLLPVDISAHLEKELGQFEPFREAGIFDPLKPVEEKIEFLRDYCLGYTEERSKLWFWASDLNVITDRIKNHRGVCRHRSEDFILLAQWLGVEAHLVKSADHEFVEIPYLGEGGKARYIRFNLGGGDVLDLTKESDLGESVFKAVKAEEEKTESPLPQPAPSVAMADEKETNAPVIGDEKKEAALAVLDEKKLSTIEDAKEAQRHFDYYRSVFQAASTVKPLDSFETIFESKDQRAALIHIDPTMDPKVVCHSLAEKMPGKKVLYISRPEDFLQYMEPKGLTPEGEEKKIEVKPLREMLESKEEIALVINWNNFKKEAGAKPGMIAKYQSVIDTANRSLLGVLITNPNLKVIGLNRVEPGEPIDTAFISRCQQYSLNPNALSKSTSVVLNEKAMPIEINLGYQLNWEDRLWGENNLGKFEESDFIMAIRAKKPIRLSLTNVPENEELKLFLYRLQVEKAFLLNGELVKVEAPIQVVQTHQDNKLKLENLVVHPSEVGFEGHEKIYLRLNNLYECYKSYRYLPEGGMATDKGYVARKDFDANKTIFYLTETIPESEWMAFQKKIQALIPEGQTLHFVLAPGVSIKGVMTNDQEISQAKTDPDELKLDSSAPSVLVSNDPDYVTYQLAKNIPHAEVRHLTPQGGYKSLIARAYKKDNQLVYEEQAILKSLRAGKTVILEGSLPKELYQSLLPLLSDPPRLYSNGEWIPKAGEKLGRLIVVMPPNPLKLLNATKLDYTLQHYANQLNNEDKKNELYVQQVIRFYEYVNKIPHQFAMPGRPSEPPCSYRLIKRMVKRLQNPILELHKHNPIKGLFLFNYKKGSDDYAYLNVVSKYLFAAKDGSGARDRKLFRVLKKLGIKTFNDLKNKKDSVWKLLNCLNGQALHALLGDMQQALDPKASYPTLKTDLLQKLFDEKVDPLLKNEPAKVVKKRFRPEKYKAQFKALLDDPDEPFIVLEGPPGVGKTHVVNEIFGEKGYFVGTPESILAWARQKPTADGKIIPLFLDEANMELPGTWDFLKGILEDRKVSFKDENGNDITLSPLHKVIVAANPPKSKSDKTRHEHRLFTQGPETLHFKKPEKAFLEKVALNKILSHFKLYDENTNRKYAKLLLKAYALFEKVCPYEITSTRDIKSLASRFVVGVNYAEKDGLTLDEVLWRACVIEFGPTIQDPKQRKNYIDQLRQEIGLPTLEDKEQGLKSVAGGHLLPTEKLYLADAIMDDLRLRDYEIEHGTQGLLYFKQLAVTEGSPGVGKSVLIRKILESKGITEQGNGNNKYVVIVPGSAEASEKLTEAFFNGWYVIIDEGNVDPSLQKKMTFYSLGIRTPEDDPERVITPGCRFYTTQNPTHLPDRFVLPDATRNRAHFGYHDELSEDELMRYATDKNLAFSAQFVKAYLSEAQKPNSGVNPRVYFEILKKPLSVPPPVVEPASAPVVVEVPPPSLVDHSFLNANNDQKEERDTKLIIPYALLKEFREEFKIEKDRFEARYKEVLDKIRDSRVGKENKDVTQNEPLDPKTMKLTLEQIVELRDQKIKSVDDYLNSKHPRYEDLIEKLKDLQENSFSTGKWFGGLTRQGTFSVTGRNNIQQLLQSVEAKYKALTLILQAGQRKNSK